MMKNMERLNLFQLAADNGDPLKSRHAALLSSCPPPTAARIASFTARIENESGISINMTLPKMQGFLQHRRYLSPHELAQRRAIISGKTPEDELRAVQGRYYERRMAFDGAFDQGESFLYGALNIGGAGVDSDNYGGFCVFFDPSIFSKLECAFVPGNSLDLYMPAEHCPGLQTEKLRDEVASPSQRHYLAALKHKEDIPNTGEIGWPAMLCSQEGFVEAIFVGILEPSAIGELRLSKNAMQNYANLILDDYFGTLSEPGRAELEAYKACVEQLETLGFKPKEA